MSNMTYGQLLAVLESAVQENPKLQDELVLVYQTDAWAREVSRLQLGCGGNCIITTRQRSEDARSS